MPKIIGESLASHRELTRTRLFEALGSLMAEQSFESITMSQIAERAGVGRTAVYNHFADKEVLLLAYMRQVTEEFTSVLSERLSTEPDPLMRLRLYIRSHVPDDQPVPRESGMGLRRQMSDRGASHLHDHVGMVGEVLISILDDAMGRGLIAQRIRWARFISFMRRWRASVSRRMRRTVSRRWRWWRPLFCEAWVPPRRTCVMSPLRLSLPGNSGRAASVDSDITQGSSGPD